MAFFLGGPSACAPAARTVEPSAPPAHGPASAPASEAVAEATPEPPAALSSGPEPSAEPRAVASFTTPRGSTTSCVGTRLDLVRARVRFDLGGALSSDSYAWVASVVDERIAELLGPGQHFACGPLARCYEPSATPSSAALAELARAPLPSAALDARPRPARWSERYELAVIALGSGRWRAEAAAPRSIAGDAAWQSAIGGALPSFAALGQLAGHDAALVAMLPASEAGGTDPGSTGPRESTRSGMAGEAAKPDAVSRPNEESQSDLQPDAVPLAARRAALVRTVPADADERALLLLAPATARSRRALARAARALARGTSAAVRETQGGLLQLTLSGPPEVTLRELESLSANFAQLTSASGSKGDAAPESAGTEPAPLDRACDARLGDRLAPPSRSAVLDALRDAAVLTVLERHAPEKVPAGEAPPPDSVLTGPLAALHFAGRAFLVGAGDRVVKPAN